jgi:hypothetical protein
MSLSIFPLFTVFEGPTIRDTLRVGDWNKQSYKGFDTSKLLDAAVKNGDWVCLRRGPNGSKPSLWVRVR